LVLNNPENIKPYEVNRVSTIFGKIIWYFIKIPWKSTCEDPFMLRSDWLS